MFYASVKHGDNQVAATLGPAGTLNEAKQVGKRLAFECDKPLEELYVEVRTLDGELVDRVKAYSTPHSISN